MSDITFVIFDMDDVLYDFDHDFRLRALATLTGRDPADIDRDVWGGPHENLAEAGNPATAEAYLDQFQALLGYPIDEATWTDIRRRMKTPRPGVLDMARALKGRVELALLTNNGMLLKKALPGCAPEVIEIFAEKAHVSAEFGARKPDPEVFRRICARYGHRPEASAFVDDRQENIEGARACGLSAHLYRDEAGLRAYLTDLGLLAGSHQQDDLK